MGKREITLVLGGVRSGKSRYALERVTAYPKPWRMIATAEAWDEEMKDRIARHRAERGDGWLVEEEPLDLPGALRRCGEGGAPVLVDCLTLWLTNLMMAERDVAAAGDELVSALAACAVPVVLVSNEVGLGIVPDNALARAFRDEAGRLHQRVAAVADRVIFMVAGLPMTVKSP